MLFDLVFWSFMIALAPWALSLAWQQTASIVHGLVSILHWAWRSERFFPSAIPSTMARNKSEFGLASNLMVVENPRRAQTAAVVTLIKPSRSSTGYRTRNHRCMV